MRVTLFKSLIFLVFVGVLTRFAAPTVADDHTTTVPLARFEPESRIAFTSFDLRDGLPDNEILSVAQDSRGFIWLGTRHGGLSRFDGHEFRNFVHDANDPTSVSSNWIWTLHVDRLGILWVGTNGGGLNRYDPQTESFVRYAVSAEAPGLLPDDNIKSFLEDDQGRMWVGSNAGLSLYDRETDSFETPLFGGAENRSVRAVMQERDGGTIWLGTRRNGLIRYDPTDQTVVNYRHRRGDPTSLSNNAVTRIFEDDAGNIWVATRRGLNRYDETRDIFERVPLIGDDQTESSLKYITRIHQDKTGRLWSGTRDGLYLYDPAKTVFEIINPSMKGRVGTPPGDVTDIFEDTIGNLWIGSRSNGVYFLDAAPSPYLLTQTWSLPAFATPAHNNISAVHMDRSGRLWSGGTGTPLSVFEDTWIDYPAEKESNGSPQRVQAIDSASVDKVWVGARDGLALYQGDGVRSFVHDPDDPQSISGNAVLDLAADARGGVWIAVDGDGVDYFDGRYFDRFDGGEEAGGLPSRYPKSVLPDGNGGVWVGMNNEGLVHIDRANRRVQKYLPNPDGIEDEVSNFVRHIAEGSDGTLWLVTNNGLYGFDPDSRTFTHHLTAEDGLLSDTLMASIEDDQGVLWISSLSGLTRFDPATGALEALDIAKDLQGGRFLPRAVTRDGFGRLYWGTGRGILSFHPSEIRVPPKSAAVVLTRLEIDGADVAISPEGDILGQSITTADKIEIPAGHRQFSLAMSDLKFGGGQGEALFYRLAGLETVGQGVGSDNRVATYRNVPPGQYEFQIGTAATGGVTKAALQIRVLPLWWQTQWFRWGLALLAVLALGSVFAYQNRIARKFRELAMFADQSPHPVIRIDQNNQLAYANDAARFVTEWHGLSLGQSVPESWSDPIEKVRRTGLPQDLEEHDKDAERHAIFTFSPLNDTESINVFGRDTTKRNALHRQLVQSQKMEAIGQLAGGMAHDFNNILAIVQGNLELTVLEDDPSPETKVKLDEALEAVTKGSELTRRLLAFSRKQKLLTTSTDINSVLEGLHSLLSRLLDSRYTISLDLQDDLWPCLADVSQFENAVVNLALNARDAMPDGGSLVLRTANIHGADVPSLPQEDDLSGDFVLLQVTDTGSGIPEENLDQIYEPFFTTKDVDKGTGLGLSMVFGFAKQSSGHLSVSSEVGVGTTFDLYLPRAVEPRLTDKRQP